MQYSRQLDISDGDSSLAMVQLKPWFTPANDSYFGASGDTIHSIPLASSKYIWYYGILD